ncbi:hypothetical protein [Herbaspirillum sp. alder98]|uniref:hypothetical protein n=1 Tax=Herbaspirillum sp. alder98 TaxID=2913096 RepID=UPI001CD8389C|nr:hypothetical protein [Herbaspirillum sp. alder98]MCA1325134.1 hypothetical protein [Herbaspirillum sp. alder98]
MSSKPKEDVMLSRAELAFREAFERLKAGTSDLIPRGSRVTQNNIAKEAGVDPSALKKSRYPSLILEIQNWIGRHPQTAGTSSNNGIHLRKKKNRSLKNMIEALKIERDHAISLLLEADALILDLTQENQDLKNKISKSNIHNLHRS